MSRRLHAAALSGALVANTLLPATVAVADEPPSLLVEDFEDADVAYTTSVPEFSDGAGDFFTRTAGANIGGFVDVTGHEATSWFHGMDLDGEGATLPLTMTFGDIEVASFDSLGVALLAAEDDDGTNEDWDASDSVTIEARLDDGDLVPVVCFANDGSTFNTAPLVDTDCDGTGDGDEITATFATVFGALDGTATTLDLVVTWDLDAGDEDLAIDEIRITTADGGDSSGGGSDPEEPATCTADDTPISAVQGDGASSPLVGQTVSIQGVVTLASAEYGGFWVQEEPDDEDGDPATSEGIFVFDLRGQPEIGAVVQVTDRVDERFGLTQMAFGDVERCTDVEAAAVTPTDLTLPLGDVERESLESMLVVTTQDLDITGLFSRFGELGLTAQDAPLVQPTSLFAPTDPAAQALHDEQTEHLIKLDDLSGEDFGRTGDAAVWTSANGGIGPRPGDVVEAGLVATLDYTFGAYKLQPASFPDVVEQGESPRTDAPSLAGGNDIVSFNVLNYFNTVGDSSELRGAQNVEDFAVQTAKIVDAMVEMDAAVYGLVEIENDYEEFYDDDETTVPAIVDLVAALNGRAGAGTYAFVQPDEELLTDAGFGGLGPDAIAQAFVYRTDRAVPVGEAATFDIDALLEGDVENNRWPLAQTFKVDEEFVEVVASHLKSKGSSCTDTAGPGFGFGDDVGSDLLGNCNLTREYAAQRLVEWVEDGATGFPTDDTLLIGDFNSYEEEGPIELLVEAGYVDLVQRDGDNAFTYKFDGRYGRLDYAFASPSLADKVVDAAVWQANSLEFYNNLYEINAVDQTAYASSDHDPVIVSLASDDRNGAAGMGNGAKRR